MISNDERREVAARLRNYENLRESSRESPICAFLDALGVGYLDWKGVCSRLADLIEPEPERTCKIENAGNVPENIIEIETVWFCSECGSPIYNDMTPSYCIYCGAKVVE